MKKSLANQVAKLWNENFGGITDATHTTASVERAYRKGIYEVIIRADKENDGHAFFHSEDFVVVKRAFGLSGLMSIYDGKIIGRLY